MPRHQAYPLQELITQLLSQHHMLAASELRQLLDAEGHAFNKTSIYRALEQLLQKDLICQYQFDLKEAKYELRANHHHHLVCQGCGEVDTLPCTGSICHEVKNFQVTHHHLTLYGFCQNCQEMSASVAE